MNWSSNLIFTAFGACENQVRNFFCRQNFPFIELDFSKLIFQNSSTDQQGVSKSNKYAKNAMEIVHKPKNVGSNNLEIFFSLYDAIFNSTVHFKIVSLFSLGFVM
jgi:hypothetical protein